MKLRSTDLYVLLLLTALTALRTGSSLPVSHGSSSSESIVTDDDSDSEDSSVNEVDRKLTPIADDSDFDAAEVNNRIPIIFSELSDIERTLSSDGSVTGSGEFKMTGDHAHSTTASGETNVRLAPKYMLDLYDKFSNDKYSHPMANIVRSFTNMNTGTVWSWYPHAVTSVR